MRRVVAVAVALVVLAGCGGGGATGAKGDALAATQSNLGDIRSGVLDLRFVAGAGTGKSEVGFTLAGPFRVAEKKGTMPTADLRYTRITGDARRTLRFLSTGTEAFAEVDGTTYALDRDQVADLTNRGVKDAGGLSGLHLDDWISDPTTRPGPTRDGVAVDRITGTVDGVAALNDVISLALDLGADESARPIAGDDVERVRKSITKATVELLTGRADRLLRHLRVDLTFAADASEELTDALGDLAGLRLAMEVGVSKPNSPVTVVAPADAKPSSELPRP